MDKADLTIKEHPQGGCGHAESVGYVPESRSDNDASWLLLLCLDNVARVTCFASKIVASGNVTVLRMRSHGGQDENCGES